MNGKGDSPRSCFSKEYRDNYDHIFRTKKYDAVFKTITGPDWKRALERAKSSRNSVRDQIQAETAKRKP